MGRLIAIAIWFGVIVVLTAGSVELVVLLAKPWHDICTDFGLPISVCTVSLAFENLRQLHYSTKVFIILCWIIGAIWLDKESRF